MVPAELIDYPNEYNFAQLLTHFVATRVTAASTFRCGDWLRFLHNDYLDTLEQALLGYRHASAEIQQDLILLCQLLFTHETQSAAQVSSTRLMSAVLQRLAHIVKLEVSRRAGFVFIGQRMSVIPNFALDVHETVKGRQAEKPALPASSASQEP
jgi:hypothetical protein